MNTDRIYRVALVYAQQAGIEATAANMDRIIAGMLAELRPLAEEYGADFPGAALAALEPAAKCARCDSALSPAGLCSDETCPFSDYPQSDARGWSGHPDRA